MNPRLLIHIYQHPIISSFTKYTKVWAWSQPQACHPTWLSLSLSLYHINEVYMYNNKHTPYIYTHTHKYTYIYIFTCANIHIYSKSLFLNKPRTKLEYYIAKYPLSTLNVGLTIRLECLLIVSNLISLPIWVVEPSQVRYQSCIMVSKCNEFEGM